MTPTYVTFEQAKLLKEKGFDVNCTHAYCQSVNLDRPVDYCFPRINQYEPNVQEEWLAPEQWQVIEWLRVNRDIWIYVTQGYKWEWNIETIGNNPKKLYNDGLQNSPQAAYSVALDYVLNNLI